MTRRVVALVEAVPLRYSDCGHSDYGTDVAKRNAALAK